MTKRLSKFDQHIKAALDKAAFDMGLIGEFHLGHTHNSFKVALPDGVVLKLPVYKSPSCGAETYAHSAVRALRAMIHRHLEQQGLV